MSSEIRVAPHNDDAERSILGAIFLENRALDEFRAQLLPEHFYRESHRAIYRAMLALADQKRAIDVITISDLLHAQELLANVGGANALARLSNEVPTAANVMHYVGIVMERSKLRAQIAFARELEERAYHVQDVEAHQAWAESRFYDIHAQEHGRGEPISMRDAVRSEYARLDRAYKGLETEGVVAATPWPELNELLHGGFKSGELIVVAARPAMGKTAWALGVMDAAAQASSGAALFTMEMDCNSITRRMISARAKVPYATIEGAKLGEAQWRAVIDASGALAGSNLWIDDTPSLPITEFRAKARRLVRRQGVSVLLLDYLQLMRAPGHDHRREGEIAHISRELKACARELDVPIIALAQLNRDVEKRADKRPFNADLRESGQLEQDADKIIFLYRDEVYNPETEDKGIAEFIVGKHRNGELGTIRARFNGACTSFEPLPQYATEARVKREGGYPYA